jgi:hypothetical protein
MLNFLAEGVGFEPTELSLNGFQDRRLQPLGHPSSMLIYGYHLHHFGSIFLSFPKANKRGIPCPAKEPLFLEVLSA